MSNIFSNRFVQGTIAIAVIGIAFFAYQNSTGEVATDDSEVTTAEISNENSMVTATTTSEGTIENTQVEASGDNKTENAVNNASGVDNINTSADETTNNQ